MPTSNRGVPEPVEERVKVKKSCSFIFIFIYLYIQGGGDEIVIKLTSDYYTGIVHFLAVAT